MKVYIKTYGCQMNERDSENLAAQLKLRGHEIAATEAEADVFVANTCSVREAAEQKAIGKLLRISYKKKNGFPSIGVMGCMSQNKGAEIVKAVPKIDFIAGSRKTPYVADYIEEIAKRRKAGVIPQDPQKGERKKWKHNDAIINIEDDETSHNLISLHDFSKSQICANISIMQGCAMKCSYCIVPKTRGIERSRPMEDIVKEAETLAKSGAKEIQLLGQVVNAYGRGEMPSSEGKSPFVQLLEKINKIEGIERVRFVSPHPSFFKEDLIAAYSKLDKVCEYAHLPLQSGSDRVLKEMRRPYSAEKFIKIAKALKASKEIFSLSTDIIVGYPNETEEDFLKTCEVFKECAFDMAYIFKYSPRIGTVSAELEDNVSEAEKERRNQILLEILKKQSLDFNERLVGTYQEVLVEGKAKRGLGNLLGRTRTHRKVIFKAPEELIGKLVSVKIISAGVSAMDGVLE
ncbi:MAG: tRNA (N6-isopentenyl adenosine(37)-C2)-methylthiotransferase MiaB [Opitutales bacterium]|nr:tRNA (N6-isopentenyl adenosine(37)-C2)-methylthiotransferase MiaB [Opitutales bacterium]